MDLAFRSLRLHSHPTLGWGNQKLACIGKASIQVGCAIYSQIATVNRELNVGIRHVKPGGWVELNEFDPWLHSDDGTLKKDMYMSRFYDLVHKATAMKGTFAPLSG